MALVKGSTIIVRTTGMTAAFSGDGFPTVTRNGVEMTPDESKKAYEAARNSGIILEEVAIK